MKKVKSYTGIWNVEKVLYSINDFNLPDYLFTNGVVRADRVCHYPVCRPATTEHD